MSDTLAKDGRKNEEDRGEERVLHASLVPLQALRYSGRFAFFFRGPLSIPCRAHARTENRNGKKGSARLLDFMACFMASNIARGAMGSTFTREIAIADHPFGHWFVEYCQ